MFCQSSCVKSKKLENKLTNNKKLQSVKIADVDIAIQMLNKYIDAQAINPPVSALGTLKIEPQNETFQKNVITAFNDLGVMTGAALTYAPYLNVFVSDDPFGD